MVHDAGTYHRSYYEALEYIEEFAQHSSRRNGWQKPDFRSVDLGPASWAHDMRSLDTCIMTVWAGGNLAWECVHTTMWPHHETSGWATEGLWHRSSTTFRNSACAVLLFSIFSRAIVYESPDLACSSVLLLSNHTMPSAE